MLAYNTQQITKISCHFRPSGAMSDTENILHRSALRFTATVASDFCAIIATRVLASIMSSELDGHGAHAQLSCVYLVSTLDVMHVIKSTRLPPSLLGRAWERGYHYCTHVLSSVYAYIFMRTKMGV